jgi:hypothetical protein
MDARGGLPRFDGWCADSSRLIARGETDLTIQIGAVAIDHEETPNAVRRCRSIVIAPGATNAEVCPLIGVAIDIAEPGLDEAGFVLRSDGLPLRASSPRRGPPYLPTLGEVLRSIRGIVVGEEPHE